MKRKKIILSFLVFVLFTTACGRFSVPTNANAAFEKFTLNLFREDAAANTLGLHYTVQDPAAYGIQDAPVTFGSYDTDEAQSLAAAENCTALLDKFSYGSLSDRNQLTYDILSYSLQMEKEGAKYLLYEEPLRPLTGIHAQLPVLLAEYTFSGRDDVETYLKLIETMPDYFASLIRFEQRKAEAGLFMSESALDSVLEQTDAFLSMGEEHYLLSTFSRRLDALKDLSEAEKERFCSRNRKLLKSAVFPAYRQLADGLNDLRGDSKNQQGLCYFPHGKDYYAFLARRETGSSRTVEEMLTLIQNQISDDLLAIQASASGSDFPSRTTVPSASPEEILTELETAICGAFPAPEDVNVQVNYVPEALEPYLSPAFYLIPSIDNTAENVIYVNQGSVPDGLSLFTTLAHEGYPGHLYQTTRYAAQNPDPVRSLFSFKGYVEGWATYAEMCSYYLAPLDKPAATLLQKNSSAILGLHALADIGIHYGGWDEARTAQFFLAYGIEDTDVVHEIYQLILSDPANYLTYYMGYLEILELKKEQIKKEKASFSQKEFHKRLLDAGPAPFEIIRRQLERR